MVVLAAARTINLFVAFRQKLSRSRQNLFTYSKILFACLATNLVSLATQQVQSLIMCGTFLTAVCLNIVGDNTTSSVINGGIVFPNWLLKVILSDPRDEIRHDVLPLYSLCLREGIVIVNRKLK